MENTTQPAANLTSAEVKYGRPTIKVDAGIAIPAGGHPGVPALYPWQTMAVGESFEIPSDKNVHHFRRGAYMAAIKHSRKFSVRKMPDGTHRCWRVA